MTPQALRPPCPLRSQAHREAEGDDEVLTLRQQLRECQTALKEKADLLAVAELQFEARPVRYGI